MSTLNKKTLVVGDVMMGLERAPVIKSNVILKEAMEVMGQAGLGIVCIVNGENKLLGILTDGDIRRKLLKVQKPFSALFVDDAIDHGSRSPLTVNSLDNLEYAVDLMEKKQIWDLPVIDDSGYLVGLLHLHPAIQALLKIHKEMN